MNPLNSQQHPSIATQYYVTGMPPLTSPTSILKSNVSHAVTAVTQHQPIVVSTSNSVGCASKGLATGSSVMDSTKYVTTKTNYVPVLLTNQTLISSVDPIKHQQQQHPPNLTPPCMRNITPVVTATSTSITNIPLITGNKISNSAAGNITYQILPTSQTNILPPVITAANGTVSVLLASTQPPGHVATPIIIRNTPTAAATTAKAVQLQQNIQFSTKQQQQMEHQQQQKPKLNNFNPQSYNPEILKQIVVGNPDSETASILAPGTTLLKPMTLQNKTIVQQSSQQQIINKTVKNTKTIQQPHQLLQKHNNQSTIATSNNSSKMISTLGMDLVKATVATQIVQKLPQVSLLQSSTKNSANIKEIINESVTVLNNPLEVKVGNLNSEVSLIKKPNVSTTEIKFRESSSPKTSNIRQSDSVENIKQDLDNSSKLNTKTSLSKELFEGKESHELSSLLKSSQDLKKSVSVGDKIINTSFNIQVEKQKSLLKPKICSKKPIESEENGLPHRTSPRSHRSNSYNTSHESSAKTLTTNNERRYSMPSKFDLVANEKMTNNSIQCQSETELIKSQELEIFFEDEEYLESSGDKSSVASEKSHGVNKSLPDDKEIKTIIETSAGNEELAVFSESKEMEILTPNESQEKDNKKKIYVQKRDNMDADTETKPPQDVNAKGNSSDDDDVTILPSEAVEIEQIEIDDDDDDNEKDTIQTKSGLYLLEDKELQLNDSLLCDEQFIVSSSSSISNNSSDHNSATPSLIKSPQNENTATPLLKKTLMETKVFDKKEEPHSNGYSSVLEMLSNFSMLSWRERIGAARGTNLKFQLNEFNLIQLYEKSMPNKRIHTAYEKPIYERESSHKRNENSEPPTYYMCRRCNVQGPSVDFLAPEFCSLSCLKRDCRKRRDDTANSIRKRNRMNNYNHFTNNIYNSGNANETSNLNSPPPLTYIRKPKFRWTTYMNRNYNVVAAPISLFLNPFPTGPNNFLVGMKLEAIDPENCALFCVCTIISVTGYRLKLSFDGYSNAYDFWLNADSMDIFPPGWCAKTNRILQPPKGTITNKFNWGAYLNKEKALPAPRYLFTHLNSSSLAHHNPFKVGMHLEAEDLNDTGKLCVASVADVLDDRIRIHFDGWDDCYDIIVDINSPYIHPCGWHEGRQQLVVPPDCENVAFNWNDYIRTQGTGEAAREELFAHREPIGFKPNMRLEVVDPRNPSLIRPATIVSHKGHRVKLHLDGWPSDYCFWLEDDSPDLHPIGWCDATGHDLEPPPGFQILKQKMPCPVDGCRGIGNAKNAFKCFHATRDGCPYAAENWRTVVEKPQRLDYDYILRPAHKQSQHALAPKVANPQSSLTEQQILERLQMLDNIKTRNVLVQQDILPTNHNDLLGGFTLPHLKNEDTKEMKLPKIISSTSTSPSTSHLLNQDSKKSSLDINIDIAREYLYDYGPRLQQNFTLWQKNCSFDAEKIKRNPLKWSTMEVSVFVDLYLNCRQTATLFNHEDIDGEAFLLLQQQDLTENLDIKLGPAVKLYTCILQLRTLAVTKFDVPYKRLLFKK